MRFFFSYSRQNKDHFLREFFDDLNEEVQTRSGDNLEEGFFDPSDSNIGDFWEQLEAALGRSRVFVAAVTPGFVASEFCAKEWGAFEARLKNYASNRGGILPPLILPLIWIPVLAELPAAIANRRYVHGDSGDIWNLKGLKQLCKLKGQFAGEYAGYLEALAYSIVTRGSQFADLDTITEAHEPAQLPWDLREASRHPYPPPTPHPGLLTPQTAAADIFLCYSRTDSNRAQTLAARLRNQGWSVFIDLQTPIGERWDQKIERELHAARAVIVLWSSASRTSDFVLEEAEYGKKKGNLYPALIDNVEIPYGFGRIQTADLINWRGLGESPGLTQLLESLRGRLEVHAGSSATVPPDPSRS